MDFLVRIIDLCGCLLDVLVPLSWASYVYARNQAGPYYTAHQAALKQNKEPPPPDKWCRVADILFYVAAGITLLWMMRLGRLQQLPVRG